jgi:hypothetical protein
MRYCPAEFDAARLKARTVVIADEPSWKVEEPTEGGSIDRAGTATEAALQWSGLRAKGRFLPPG